MEEEKVSNRPSTREVIIDVSSAFNTIAVNELLVKQLNKYNIGDIAKTALDIYIKDRTLMPFCDKEDYSKPVSLSKWPTLLGLIKVVTKDKYSTVKQVTVWNTFMVYFNAFNRIFEAPNYPINRHPLDDVNDTMSLTKDWFKFPYRIRKMKVLGRRKVLLIFTVPVV